MIDINIKGQDKKYSIVFDRDEISSIKTKLEEIICEKRFVIVISKKVYSLYKKQLNFDKTNLFILKDGEKEKNFKNYKKITDFCLRKKLTRDSFIVAVGGGVLGDLAGFVAATYMRGINFIQIPTTLLACVDSSVGGKVAINTSSGKNLVGAFYQPKHVIINSKFLKTLDMKNLKAGIGEIIKYAFIEKSCGYSEIFDILNLLNENYKQILKYDNRILSRLIEYCIKLKVNVVEKDEKEKNLRRILNFGHTLGHAIEKYSNYKKYTHGECVVWGIDFVFDLALKNNLIEKDYYFLMKDLIKRFEYNNAPKIDIKKLIPIMKSDKKSTSEFLSFILPVDYLQVKEFKFDDMFTIS